MPRKSQSTRRALELIKEMQDAVKRSNARQEPPFMQASYTDSEYRRHLRGLAPDQQEAEFQRLSPEERQRLFPPDVRV